MLTFLRGLNCNSLFPNRVNRVILLFYRINITLFRGSFLECQIGCPNPEARSVVSSGPRPAQQSAGLSFIITAGTERIPRLLARLATLGSFISRTMTSQDGQATRLASLTVSSRAGQPALKISILTFGAHKFYLLLSC